MKLHLMQNCFGSRESTLLEHGALTLSTFRYDSGVAGLRVASERGEVVILPFQGQQIWSARFDGRDLAMKSVFPEPKPTREYLDNYGAFVLHCGLTAMGRAGEGDTHPLHGELPNAPMDACAIITGEEDGDAYVDVQSCYRHQQAFGAHYVAVVTVRLWGRRAWMRLGVEVTNLGVRPMDLMYMAHINFRPVTSARLVQSAPMDAKSVTFRPLPVGMTPTAESTTFLERVRREPVLLNTLDPTHRLDPEVVLELNYKADSKGLAHTLQVHPDGRADFVRHRPADLQVGTRWMVRNGVEDAIGIVLPGTAGPEGYTAERAKGRVASLDAGKQRSFNIEAGVLTAAEAEAAQQVIDRTLEGRG